MSNSREIIPWNMPLSGNAFRYRARLHHVPEPSGTPDDSIAHLRDFPLAVRLNQRRVNDPARDKEVLWLGGVGFTALPHVHGDEIGPDVRGSAVDRNIVTGNNVLRRFKTAEAVLMARTDFFCR